VVCPLDYNIKLRPNVGTPLQYPTVYRKLIRKLNFLTNTRPDIAFLVQHLSQFLQQPKEPHLVAAMHVLRYLQGEPSLGVLLSNNPTLDLFGLLCSCSHSRKSVSRFMVFFSNTLLTWKSKKQVTVSLSLLRQSIATCEE